MRNTLKNYVRKSLLKDNSRKRVYKKLCNSIRPPILHALARFYFSK